MRSKPRAVLASAVLGVLLGALATATANPARAGDPAAFKKLKAKYEKLARNQGQDASRERRGLLLDMFEHRDLKLCRKLLREAFDDERLTDNRVCAVHVLGGTGVTKDLDYLIGEFKKERERSPVIALGEGLGYTPEELAPAIAERVAKHLTKSKADLRLALLEGLGALAQPESVAVLQGLGTKLMAREHFEVNVAIGLCGKDDAVPILESQMAHPHPDVRLGAAIGLAQGGSPKALPVLTSVLGDDDPRVLDVAARALGGAGHAAAVPELIKALEGSPLSTREEIRSALRALTKTDGGHSAAAWTALLDKKGTDGSVKPPRTDLPKIPEFFGTPVASDNVVVLLDLSRSMNEMTRLERAAEATALYVESLPDDAEFAVYGVGRDLERFADEPRSGAAAKTEAAAWLREILTERWCDLDQALKDALARFPSADTFVLAVDSNPGWRGRCRETMEVFRQMNRVKRVRLIIALVMPGGRHEKSEPSQEEFEERIDQLTEMADRSGGAFIHVDE